MVYDGIIVHNTLNTFHISGVGVAGMMGIPRFREIISYSKKIQTPYMIIKLIPEIRADQNIAHKIEAYLKHTILGNLIERMDIIYDPIPKNTLNNDNIKEFVRKWNKKKIKLSLLLQKKLENRRKY